MKSRLDVMAPLNTPAEVDHVPDVGRGEVWLILVVGEVFSSEKSWGI